MGKHVYFVDAVIDSRGQRRGGERNGKLFCIKWACGTTTWEPLESLVDDNMVLEHIKPNVAHYKEVALSSPWARRLCLTCDKRVREGNIFCNSSYCQNYDYYFGDTKDNKNVLY